MKIVLNDEYYITADPLNYELVNRRRNKNAGREGCKVKNEYSERTVGYYRTLDSTIERFIECVHKEKTMEYEGTLRKYCEELKKINKQIKETLVAKVEKEVKQNGDLS